jgi:hypothetical protein
LQSEIPFDSKRKLSKIKSFSVPLCLCGLPVYAARSSLAFTPLIT